MRKKEEDQLRITLFGQTLALARATESLWLDLIFFPVASRGPDRSGFTCGSVFRDSVYGKVAASALHFDRERCYLYRRMQLLCCAVIAFDT